MLNRFAQEAKRNFSIERIHNSKWLSPHHPRPVGNKNNFHLLD